MHRMRNTIAHHTRHGSPPVSADARRSRAAASASMVFPSARNSSAASAKSFAALWRSFILRKRLPRSCLTSAAS